MESRAKLLGHSIHQQLSPFPLGLLFTAVVFDVIHLVTGDVQWSLVSFWMIAAGIIGGLLIALGSLTLPAALFVGITMEPLRCRCS